MNNREQQELANAFKAYLEAHKKLCGIWQAGDYNGEFSTLYPFEKSFDELAWDVERWANDAIATLESFHAGWKRYNVDAEEVKELGIDVTDFEVNNDDIIAVLISERQFYIFLHQSGKYSTEAMNESEYGTFEECVKLIEETMGENV